MGDDDDTIHHWPGLDPARTTAWSRDCEIGSTEVGTKRIRGAFNNVKSFPLKRIMIQLWKLKQTNGKKVLSCQALPCALSHANSRLWKYRSGCSKYNYSFNIPGDPMTITHAPHCIVPLTGIPEVVLDLTAHRGTPLVDLALECELTCFMLLPVYNEAKCQGVIEVSARQPSDLFVIYNELHLEILRVGLHLIPPKHLISPTLPLTGDLHSPRIEINNALKVAVQSHAITVGCSWIVYFNSADPSGPSLIPWMSRTLLRKFGASCFGGNPTGDDDLLKQFYCKLVVLLLKKGEGLAARALRTDQPHLCRNIYKLSENKGLMALLSAYTKSYASFVIPLRSSHTGKLAYACEFLWPQSRNHLALMEDLLLTLREHLPSFTYPSGAQLGHETLVVDFENNSSSLGSASGSEGKTVKIFPRNQKSKEPKVTRASVGMKRKAIDLHDDAGQRELNQYLEDEDEDDLVILAFYKVCHRLFFLPSSATFENLMEKIKQEFGRQWNPVGTYKIDYQVLPGKWYRLTDETCLKNCISSYRTSNGIDYIKLYVLPVEE